MNKFKIDITFIIFILLIILSPKQDILIRLLIALLIHELGHLIIIFLFKIKIYELKLLSTGFIMNIDEFDLTFFNSILLYASGIVFNLILYFINIDDKLSQISLILAIINLIFIYPLDGFQLIKTILEYYIPYYYSLNLSIIISIINVFLVFIIGIYLKIDIYIFINLFYLVYLNYVFYKSKNILYNKFLLNRYLYKKNRKIKFIYNKICPIKYIYKFHLSIFNKRNIIFSEETIIYHYFNK